MICLSLSILAFIFWRASVCLGAGLTLSLKLLLSTLDTGLKLLDVLLGLGHKGLLIIKLSRQHVDILLLVSNGILNVSLLYLEIIDRVLSHLEVSFNLPLLLFNGSSGLLLLVKSSLKLVKSGLKLRLDLAEVLHLLLSTHEVLIGLGLGCRQVLLLLVELVDDLILLSNFVLEGPDGVVTVALLSLHLGDHQLNILHVLLDGTNAARVSLDLLGQDNSGVLLSLEDLILAGQSNISLSLEGIGLGLSVSVNRDAALLLRKLLGHGGDLTLEVIHAALKLGSLVKSSLVLAIGLIGLLLKQPELLLGVGTTNHGPGLLDDDEPSPISHLEVLPEVPLGNLDQLPLVPLGGVHLAADPLEDLTLDESDPFDDKVVTGLLKLSQSTSPEEDQGVAQPVPLAVKVNLVHEGIGGGLVVAGAGDLSLAEARISHLVVRIEHPIRESTHADPDTLEHTITGQLVHDKRRLNLSGLLVGVGHKATDKVRSTVVQGGHQLSKRDEVDRGHSLAAASLLLLLAIVLGSSGGLSRVVSPQHVKKDTLGGGLEDLDNGVVDRVLVFVQPVGDVVVDNASIMRNTKVSIFVSLGCRLQEDGKLAKRSLQLLLKGLVSGLGEERLLLKDSPKSHRLLKHNDGSLQVHAEVNHDPVNALLDVLFLLNNKHVVVEELLELLVDKVDGDLLEAIVLENLKTSNIQDSAEVGLLKGGIN